jgi:hypothetical protein
MAKVKLGSNAQFGGAGKSLVVIQDRCYAYSGEVSTSDTTELTVLEFTTGKYITVIRLQYGSSTGGGVDVKTRAYLNGTTMIEIIHAANYDENQDAKIPMELLLPPLSNFKFTIQGQSTQDSDWSVWLHGRLYA